MSVYNVDFRRWTSIDVDKKELKVIGYLTVSDDEFERIKTLRKLLDKIIEKYSSFIQYKKDEGVFDPYSVVVRHDGDYLLSISFEIIFNLEKLKQEEKLEEILSLIKEIEKYMKEQEKEILES